MWVCGVYVCVVCVYECVCVCVCGVCVCVALVSVECGLNELFVKPRGDNFGMIQNFLVVQRNISRSAAAEPKAQNLVNSPPFCRKAASL